MERIVLLAVAAAWAAVLLPPLLRNRSDSRPGSSVSDFSRQLSSLQRSVPTRGMAPMRSMSRPLTQASMTSPLARSAAGGRPAQMYRALSVVPAPSRESLGTASLQRRSHGDVGGAQPQSEQSHRQSHVHRSTGYREEIRRRRSNVLFLLTMAFGASLFLAATTHSDAMMYALALSFLSLCAYCYRLVQLRQTERQTQLHDTAWFRAA